MVFLLALVTGEVKKGVTQEELSNVSRDELIELAIIAMCRADEECELRTQSETRLAEVEQQLR